MENKEKKSILNIFDIVVLALCAALAAAFFIINSMVPTVDMTPELYEVHYTLEIVGMKNKLAYEVLPGDVLTEKSGVVLGEVVSVEVTPAAAANTETATVRMVARCTQSERWVKINDSFILRVGTAVTVEGPGYSGSGYITDLEIGDLE